MFVSCSLFRVLLIKKIGSKDLSSWICSYKSEKGYSQNDSDEICQDVINIEAAIGQEVLNPLCNEGCNEAICEPDRDIG